MEIATLISLLVDEGLTFVAIAVALWVAISKTIPTTTYERIASSRDAREAKRAELELARMQETRKTEDRLFNITERGSLALAELGSALHDLKRSYSEQAQAFESLAATQTAQTQLMQECAAGLVTLRRRTDHIERLLAEPGPAGETETPLPQRRR